MNTKMKTTWLIVAALALAVSVAGCKDKSEKKDTPTGKTGEGTGSGSDKGTGEGSAKGSGEAVGQAEKKEAGTGLAGDGKAVETAEPTSKASAVIDAVKTDQAEQAALTGSTPAVAKNAALMEGMDTEDKGDLKLVVNDNGDKSEMRTAVAETLTNVIAMLNGGIKFPKDIPVIMDKCGQPNAYWSPTDQAITFCDEWAPFFASAFSRYKTDPADIKRMALNTVIETFIHELGHCLIDVWKLPASGNQEDAADQVAAFVLIGESDETSQIMLDAAEAFMILAVTRGEQGRNNYADEHSLDQVRFYNFACLVYGSNPDKYMDLVLDYDLPLARADRCENEFRLMRSAWNGLLEKILITG